MRTRICKKCGKIFDVPTGKNMYMCQECAKISKKEGVLRERTCKNCGITFVGYPRSMYCEKCRIKKRKESAKKYRKSGPKRPIGSVDFFCRAGIHMLLIVAGKDIAKTVMNSR